MNQPQDPTNLIQYMGATQANNNPQIPNPVQANPSDNRNNK